MTDPLALEVVTTKLSLKAKSNGNGPPGERRADFDEVVGHAKGQDKVSRGQKHFDELKLR